MSKAAYWQRGEALDYANKTGATIDENTIVKLGTTRIGVAGTDIPNGTVGSVHVEGVYKIKKTAAGAIDLGAAVYFDGTGITTDATSNTPAGYAAAAAEAADDTVLVKLLG